MPITIPQGLKGLKGYNSLNDYEKDMFLRKHAKILSTYEDPSEMNEAAEVLYNNQNFVNHFGISAFKKMDDGTYNSYELRNNYLKDSVVNTEFNKLYSPFNTDGTRNNNKGLGAEWEKYNKLSPDAKLELMESGYLTPAEFEKAHPKIPSSGDVIEKGLGNGILGKAVKSVWNQLGAIGLNPLAASDWAKDMTQETLNQRLKEKNDKIIQDIYNTDIDKNTDALEDQVSSVYYSPQLANLTDNQVKKAFIKAIYGNRDKGDLGIPEFASHYGNGTAGDISEEMQDFSVDDMRRILAKRQVYYANMSPEMASTALNNEAKRYITERQGVAKKLGLFLIDSGISTLSYTADKINGVAEVGRTVKDLIMDKPIVMVDDKGEIIDPNKTHVAKGKDGKLYYQDKQGQIHSVHKEAVSYSTLHQMGKNEDGSDIEGAFGIDFLTTNPQYWTRAEQFKTLDENAQKQYEKRGSSPYQVSYNPGEDSNLWYESFKMWTFALADKGLELLPYGIGKIGKGVSAMSKLGKIVQGFGKTLETTGKYLSQGTKSGQIIQGLLGAGGIAYAYSRGSFQETLEKNLANAEQAVSDLSQNEIAKKYNENKEYKAQVDKLINERAAEIAANQIAQLQKSEGNKLINKEAINKLAQQEASKEVLGKLVQKRIQENKASDKYAALQQEAINSAGKSAITTFYPEAVKYGLVNCMGFRKFMYKPSGVASKLPASLKGLKEFTTSEGRKRLMIDASKSLTAGNKWKNFGKTVASQAWGGAWTNGTDDMQVDAAERINEDSYKKYLDAYQSGRALADTYGFADGIYSYMMGLGNSMGQESTWKSAEIGGLGSLVSISPQFTNIARLATKQGRADFKNNFGREVVRDANGIPVKNEDGTIKYKNLSKWRNLDDKLNYLVTNGVLNTYYGKKQQVKDLQNHVDYVNNLLDNYNDFKAIEHLVASNIASENALNIGDKKTADFIQAINAVNALETLGRDANDPSTMSSVVQNAKALVEKASHLGTEDNQLSKEEVDNLISQYYAANPGITQSEEHDLQAIKDIASNAQKLMEATEAYNKAEEEIQKIEKNRGETIDPEVRARLKFQQALDGHWRERKQKMQSEIGDSSSDTTPTDPNTIIATVGGRKNAGTLVKVYDQQKAEIEKDIEEQKKATGKANEEYQKAVEEEKAAREKEDSQAVLDAQNKVKETKAAFEASQQRERFMENTLSVSENKKNTLKIAMKNADVEEANERVSTAQETLDVAQRKLNEVNEKKAKWIDENGRVKKGHNKQVKKVNKEIQSWEEQVKSAKEELERSKEKILTADEIFSLDPVTRARMMNKDNRSQYSKEQQSEIEKLEKQLIMKDADALQKIQDIGLLAQRISQNSDAYNRIAQNPEAAATEFENQRILAADAAYKMIDYRNAEIASSVLNDFVQQSKKDQNITEDGVKQAVYRNLRTLNTNILNNIESENMLPDYQEQIQNAKIWRSVIDDISAVINNAEKSDKWKDNILHNFDIVANNSNSKSELLTNLEKAIDDMYGTDASKDLDYILKGLEKLGYQRDATVIESRKQRQEREEKARKEIEEKKKKAEESAEKAAEEGKKKKIEEEKRKAEEKKKSIFEGTSEEPKVDMSKEVDEETIKSIAEATGHTEEEVKRAVAELRTKHDKEKYKSWGVPSTALGNTADIIVRDFFAGELKDSYPNITKEVMLHFIKQLEDFKKDLDSKGIHIVSKEVMAHGTITTTDNEGKEHKLAVAGTLDLFGYDNKGNYYIFDMKTTRNHGEDKLSHEKPKWSRQVSMYADLLSQTYGIKIDPSRLQIIPINVYYPTPKGDGKYENPTGPEYSVDKKSGQLKMTDNSGKTANFVQDRTKDFEMRSTKSEQYKPGYTKADINWDMLPSTVQDTVEHNGEMEAFVAEENSEAPEEVVKKIMKDTQDFTLSQDENYYYVKDKKTGKEVRYARVTTVIGADRSIPIDQQWNPTNKEVVEKLTGKPSSEIAELFNKQEAENAQTDHEVNKDGSNVISVDTSTIVDKDASKAKQIGKTSGVWNAGILMEDEYGDGTIDAGEYPIVDDAGDTHKAAFTVERKGNKITFAVDKESTALNISPNEYDNSGKESVKGSLLDFTISTENRAISYKVIPHEETKKDGIKEITFESNITYTKRAPKGKKEGDTRHQDNGKGFIVIDPSDLDFVEYSKGIHHADGTPLSEDEMNDQIEESKATIKNLLTPVLNPKIGPKYYVRKIIISPKGKMIAEFSDSNHTRVPLKRNPLADDMKTSQHNENNNTESKENGVFKATSIEKKDDGWYFNGSFEGENETTQVKMKDNFDLDAAIERQISDKESELASQGYDIENENIIDDGENIQGHSLTIEEQAKGNTKIHSTSDSDSMEDANTTGNNEIEGKGGTLKANVMSEYQENTLEKEGKLVHKKGAKPNDSMNQYFAWMKAAGIKLQNIIDLELANIIKLNPHAKVKFMLVNNSKNATNDVAMQNFLMLVLDYNDSINKGITSIHNDKNGGVIESEGKKYLIVGTAGYGKRNAELFENFKRLMDTGKKDGFELKVKRKQFFDEHPNERFYVNEDLSTEVVPYSQIPGYIVKQREGEEQKDRSILELFKDKDRNPYGIDLKNAAFGIQQRKGFILKNASVDEVMIPRNRDRNMGNVFVLAPASNGKLVPIYLKVLMYNEMKEGELSKKVDNLLYDLTSSDYGTRLNAVKELSKIFYLDTNNNDILLRKNSNVVSFVINGKVDSKSFTIDANTDRNALKELFKNKMLEMNPIVNITMNVLNTPSLLKQYDEAGALMTDAAFLGTAGSSYSVYGIGNDGKMMVPNNSNAENPNNHSNSDYRKSTSQVIFGGKYYTESEGKFYLDGKEITDEKTVNQLQYLKRILDSKLSPVENKGVWNYYILSEGDHPEVVKVNKNSKEVKEATEDQAKELIKKVKEKEEKQKREAAAQKALEDALNQEPTNAEEVHLDDSQDFVIDPETGELLDPETGEVISKENMKNKENQEKKKQEVKPIPRISTSNTDKGATQTFIELQNQKKYKMRITLIIKKKWPSAPKTAKDLAEFLKRKNIEVDNIGTSKEDIEAWIKTLEDCR